MRSPAGRAAVVLVWIATSAAVDQSILRRLLELPDSPLAGEAAAILRQRRPDARYSSLPLVQRSPQRGCSARQHCGWLFLSGGAPCKGSSDPSAPAAAVAAVQQ